MKPYWEQDGSAVYHGDCLAVLPCLADASVDLIIADPPYFRVKADWWDRQWDTAEGFIAWVGRLCEQWRRVLKPNGSLYCFASPKMAARVEVEIGRWFNVLVNVVWVKQEGIHWRQNKESLRAWSPQTERIVFAEQGQDITVRYLCSECQSAGISPIQLSSLLGFKETAGSIGPRRYLREDGFAPISRDNWLILQNKTGRFARDYDEVYRPFAVSLEVPYTDVWDFPTVQDYPGKHPCEKPAPLIAHIIRASSRPGAIVLDPTCGSGVVLEVARDLGRKAIGIDVEEKWARRTAHRLQQSVLAFGE